MVMELRTEFNFGLISPFGQATEETDGSFLIFFVGDAFSIIQTFEGQEQVYKETESAPIKI